MSDVSVQQMNQTVILNNGDVSSKQQRLKPILTLPGNSMNRYSIYWHQKKVFMNVRNRYGIHSSFILGILPPFL